MDERGTWITVFGIFGGIAASGAISMWVAVAANSTWELALAALSSLMAAFCIYMVLAVLFRWPPVARRLQGPIVWKSAAQIVADDISRHPPKRERRKAP